MQRGIMDKGLREAMDPHEKLYYKRMSEYWNSLYAKAYSRACRAEDKLRWLENHGIVTNG